MKRFIYIVMLSAFYVILIMPLACKELDKTNVTLNDDDGNAATRKNAAGNNDTNPGNASTNEVDIDLNPAEGATGEFSDSTDEWGLLTNGEIEDSSKKVVYARRRIPIFGSPGGGTEILKRMKAGEPLLLSPKTPITAEWILVKNEDVEGYTRRTSVCESQICIEKKRSGLVSLFFQSRRINVPQLQVKVTNLLPQPIMSLRMTARFYYQGEFIGEAKEYVVSEVVGLDSLPTGGSTLVFFRPYYEIPQMELLNSENPVVVEIFCALEGFGYVPCGEFKIEQMLY